MEGTYRVRPSTGESISTFVCSGRTYFPQDPIDFTLDYDNSLWRSSVYLGYKDMEDRSKYEIIIAKLSDDLNIATRHYYKVNRFMKNNHKLREIWVGIEMDPEPPGFERLASLTLSVRK